MLQISRCAGRRSWTVPGPLLQPSCRRTFALRISLLDDLASRGLIADITRPEKLEEHLKCGRRTVYAGVDPTASSLHVGHLLPLMVLLHFQVRGHFVIPLIGGATGLVGDPSGRTEERVPVDPAKTEYAAMKLEKTLNKFFEHGDLYAHSRLPPSLKTVHKPMVVDNKEWLQHLGLLDFLRTAGVHIRLNTMLARESVRSRMESQKGASFTEFTYQLLQAYDFFWLYKNRDCTIQVGGSDQWGNILAGLEMINRENMCPSPSSKLVEEKGFGFTTPLLTTTSGQKFGKSAGNAIWLEENMTSVFDFYQFFLQTADADVEKQLRMLTLLSVYDIGDVMRRHWANPEKRIAQHLLADEVTELVHGKQGLQKAYTTTKIIFGSSYWTLTASEITSAFAGDPRLVFCEESEIFSNPVTHLAAGYELISSKSEAQRLVKSKGLYLNNKPVAFADYTLRRSDLIDGKVVILRAGKTKHLIIALS